MNAKSSLKKKRPVTLVALGNLSLVIIGIVLAIGLVEMIFRIQPNLVPAVIDVNPPVRRVNGFVDISYDIKHSDGDLWYWLQGTIQPLSPDQDKVLDHVRFVTDANGFPNSPSDNMTYDIVTIGDSFTEGRTVANPWPRRVAEQMNSSTLNLGQAAFGPQEEVEVLKQYGLEKQPKWIIMAYFEGNDLHDAAAYERFPPLIVMRVGRHYFTRGIDKLNSLLQEDSDPPGLTTDVDFQYPITVSINGKTRDVAFFPFYISWLTVTHEEIEYSNNYRFATETILRARDLSEASGAQFLLIYIPSKLHVYVESLSEETISQVLTNVQILQLNEAGFFDQKAQNITPEILRERIDDQATLLAEFATQHNINFLDLTTHYQDATKSGAELYYAFDTHWNQEGHDLAALLIAEHIQTMLSNEAN